MNKICYLFLVIIVVNSCSRENINQKPENTFLKTTCDQAYYNIKLFIRSENNEMYGEYSHYKDLELKKRAKEDFEQTKEAILLCDVYYNEIIRCEEKLLANEDVNMSGRLKQKKIQYLSFIYKKLINRYYIDNDLQKLYMHYYKNHQPYFCLSNFDDKKQTDLIFLNNEKLNSIMLMGTFSAYFYRDWR